VCLGPPATIRLERPLHDFLLMGAMRTAAHPTDGSVTPSSGAPRRGQRATRCCAKDRRAMVGRPVRAPSACYAPASCTSSHHGPRGTIQCRRQDGRCPGLIHRRG
jgi:hypothetical protein